MAVSPYVAGLTCRCPRCGRGKLFDGLLTVAPVCSACGLDLKKEDSGDGPARRFSPCPYPRFLSTHHPLGHRCGVDG